MGANSSAACPSPAPPEPAAGHERLTYMIRFLSRVDSQVALQSLQVPETGATDFTGIGLLSSVDKHVGTEVGHLKGRAKHERLCWGGLCPAPRPGAPHQHSEAEGSFPHSPAHLYKSGPTGFAFVGLLSRVNSSVGFQVGWPVELGSTDVTTIGFLTYSRRKENKENHI